MNHPLMEEKNISIPGSSCCSKYEPYCLVVLLALILSIHAVTITWSPLPWVDEVGYADPAIRFVLGKGFTSTAWASQASTEFWASNSPLHQFLLIPWLWLFDVSAASVRTFNLAIGGAAIALLWHAAKRGGWIINAGPRLAFAALLLLDAGVTHLFRYGRPDAITLLVAASMLWASTMQPSTKQKWTLFSLSSLVPCAGLQMLPFIAGILIILFLQARHAVWRHGWIVLAGIAAGGIALLGFLAVNGVAVRFLENTIASGHTITGEVAQMVLMKDAKSMARVDARVSGILRGYHVWFLDNSFPWLLLFLIMSLFWSMRQRLFKWSSPLTFGIVAGLGVPLLMLLAGKYPIYYTWMGCGIVSLVACSVLGTHWRQWNTPLRALFCLPLMIAALSGFPRMLVKAVQGNRADLAAISQFVQDNVKPEDHALVGDAAYYGAVKTATEVYYTSYSGGRGLRAFPPEQAARITVLLIDPSTLDSCVKKIGGTWRQVGKYEAGAESACAMNQHLQLAVYRHSN